MEGFARPIGRTTSGALSFYSDFVLSRHAFSLTSISPSMPCLQVEEKNFFDTVDFNRSPIAKDRMA